MPPSRGITTAHGIRSGEVYTLAWEADTLIDVSACLANLFKDLGQSGVRQVCMFGPYP